MGFPSSYTHLSRQRWRRFSPSVAPASDPSRAGTTPERRHRVLVDNRDPCKSPQRAQITLLGHDNALRESTVR